MASLILRPCARCQTPTPADPHIVEEDVFCPDCLDWFAECAAADALVQEVLRIGFRKRKT